MLAQSGSAASMRPSPSLSRPSLQALLVVLAPGVAPGLGDAVGHEDHHVLGAGPHRRARADHVLLHHLDGGGQGPLVVGGRPQAPGGIEEGPDVVHVPGEVLAPRPGGEAHEPEVDVGQGQERVDHPVEGREPVVGGVGALERRRLVEEEEDLDREGDLVGGLGAQLALDLEEVVIGGDLRLLLRLEPGVGTRPAGDGGEERSQGDEPKGRRTHHTTSLCRRTRTAREGRIPARAVPSTVW